MKPSRLPLLVLMVFCSASAAVFADSRPNIVLIMADDLGWSDIGCYGGEIPTPRIDSLADEGIRFTQFYNNSVCGPTRASLLTGLYCQQVGHAGNHWNQPKDFSKCFTLGEILQTAGYHTQMVGKWQGRDPATKRGFDRFFGPYCQGKISYFHEVQENPFHLDGKRWELPADGSFYLTEAFNDFAVRFIEESANDPRPFFLYVAHIAPHWPLHARDNEIAVHRDRYREKGWDAWRTDRFDRQREMGLIPKAWPLSPKRSPFPNFKEAQSPEWQSERMAVYAAQVASIDKGVGQILQALKKTDREENTLILFLSDNGAAPDGGLSPTGSGFGFSPENRRPDWRKDGVPIQPGSGPELMPGPPETFAAYGLAWATTSNTPFRDTKSSAYEGGIRTPLVARWPAGIASPLHGSLTPSIGHVIDFMPTFCELAQAEYPVEFEGRHPLPMEGISLAPLFRGENRQGHSELGWSAPRNQALRAGKWKLVNSKRGEPWELYDMEADGTETTNLAESHPDKVEELAGAWKAWAKRVSAP